MPVTRVAAVAVGIMLGACRGHRRTRILSAMVCVLVEVLQLPFIVENDVIPVDDGVTLGLLEVRGVKTDNGRR